MDARSVSGAPKSRMNASGSSTSPVSGSRTSATASRAARFSAASREDAFCTSARRRAVIRPACQTGPVSHTGEPLRLGAVVLAGGTAARMGGVDKAVIEIDGVTLLERSLAATMSAAGSGGRG